MIDPWGSSIVDYDKLVNQFGIKDFSELLGKIEDPARLMKRGVIFGHRDFDKLVPLINGKKDFAVMTGMMPSGQMHIGHKMVIDQLKWYFEKGASLSLSIADMESYAARGISFEKAKEIAINEYLANYIALGLDLTADNVNVYLQSQNKTLNDLTFKIAKRVNFNNMHAIYGFNASTNIAHLYVPLVQVADILLPQTEEFGGPKQVVVPVGVDQDPHLRLTRDIAAKLNEEYGTTVLISSHILSEVELIADDIGVINNGVLIKELTLQDIHDHQTEYIHLEVDDVARCSQILDQMGLSNLEITDDHTIRIYRCPLSGMEITGALARSGIGIESIWKKQDTLEDYFFELLGGEDK